MEVREVMKLKQAKNTNMELKDVIVGLCVNLQSKLNFNKEGDVHKVWFILKNKPNVHHKQNWTAEIFVDSDCIFRDTYCSQSEDEVSEIIEHVLCERILTNVFTYGIMSSKKVGEDLYKLNSPTSSQKEISDEVLKKTLEDINKQPMTFVPNEISDEEIEKESYIKFPILTYSVMEGHDDLNRHLRDSWVEGIKWYREQLKKKQ